MRILVIGSGAREHAILRSLSREKNQHTLFCVGGNPGIWQIAEELSGIGELDGDKIADVVNANAIELVIIGPEAPLAAGVTDILLEKCPNAKVFAPTKAAAFLESSKSFAKDVMQAANVPTGSAVKCENTQSLVFALNNADDSVPYVVKADGLAAGKGVIVTTKKSEAEKHASEVFHTGGFVILEEYLSGPEFSMFFICDGKTAVPLMPAQDFKRIYDNDEGPNTGGMGAYIPLDWLPEGTMSDCTKNIAQAVLDEMSRRGTPFTGVLFAGLVLTTDGVKVIEFNVRFGDPETQVVLEKLGSPLSELLYSAASGTLDPAQKLIWDDNYYCNVVLASAGYPETSHKGDWIDGIPAATAKGAVILQAGTAFSGSDIGQVVTNGGRVLSVVGKASDLKTARERAYNYADLVKFDGKQNRTDIALKAVNGEIYSRRKTNSMLY